MALLIERKERLERDKLEWRLEQGADKAVPFVEANKLVVLGSLVNEGQDSMRLHTRKPSGCRWLGAIRTRSISR